MKKEVIMHTNICQVSREAEFAATQARDYADYVALATYGNSTIKVIQLVGAAQRGAQIAEEAYENVQKSIQNGDDEGAENEGKKAYSAFLQVVKVHDSITNNLCITGKVTESVLRYENGGYCYREPGYPECKCSPDGSNGSFPKNYVRSKDI